MIKRISAVIISGIMLSGCALVGSPNEFRDTNAMILESNNGKLEAFGKALAYCAGEKGCLVGVSMAYAGKMGDRELIQPERTSEILRNVVPFVSLGLQAVDMFYGGGVGGTGSAGYVVTGDNNTFSGNGNNLEATGGSSLSSPFSSSNNFSWSTNNKDYSLGTGYEGAVVDSGVTGDLAEVPVAEVTTE